ncbi:MAG: hypothetical protein LBQ88_06525 [Treponema sp.]|nr:hypothetical protein [Treponema sp.]
MKIFEQAFNNNSRKSLNLAVELFPGEVWTEIAPSIHLAGSRSPHSEEQARILEKEIAQARLLAAQGHAVYLLPENGPRGRKHPDAIVDGLVMEFKTITGSPRKVRENYKDARKKADNVFLKIDPDYSPEQVLRLLVGTVKRGAYSGGLIIAYFTTLKKIYYWQTDSLI